MKNKIIFSIIFSLVLGAGSILFITTSNTHQDQRIYRDFFIVTGYKTKFPFELAVENGTTYAEAWAMLDPINQATPLKLFRKADKGGSRVVWEEVDGNARIIKDTLIKAEYK